MPDADLAVRLHLLSTIEHLGGRRERLACPVGSDRRIGAPRPSGDSISPPTRKVWHENVTSNMQLDLLQNPPTPRATVTSIEGAFQVVAELGESLGVLEDRSRVDVQHAVRQLPDRVLG